MEDEPPPQSSALPLQSTTVPLPQTSTLPPPQTGASPLPQTSALPLPQAVSSVIVGSGTSDQMTPTSKQGAGPRKGRDGKGKARKVIVTCTLKAPYSHVYIKGMCTLKAPYSHVYIKGMCTLKVPYRKILALNFHFSLKSSVFIIPRLTC